MVRDRYDPVNFLMICEIMDLLLINGPNLNMLGQREPGLYGSTTLSQIEVALKEKAQAENVQIDCFQSNFEGALVDRIQQSAGIVEGILINAGALTHTSIVLRDALLSTAIPYVELHLSNTYARESFRQKSYLSDRAIGVVTGFGANSYFVAFEGLLLHLRQSTIT